MKSLYDSCTDDPSFFYLHSMGDVTGTKKDLFLLLFLFALVIALFYPVFYSEYIYTDEAVELWLYRKGTDFHMFLPQGRSITELFSRWLFEPVTTIKGLTPLRLFAFGGWMLCIPLWYYTIKKIAVKESLPEILGFFATLYLVCTPLFGLSIGWLAVLGVFMANTAGLLSGYLLYTAITYKNSSAFRTTVYAVLSIVAGLISLFTYQSGFGCFLLPFFLHLLGNAPDNRRLVIGFAGCLLMYGVYYLLFRYSLTLYNLQPPERANIQLKPIGKLKFLFTRALSSSFHFTYLFNEKSITGFILYAILLGATAVSIFIQKKALSFFMRIQYLFTVCVFFAFIYLPSLLVKENYASNRTLLALNMAVFFLVAVIALKYCKTRGKQKIFVTTIGVLFIINAWYNFNRGFLQPVKEEYTSLRSYITANYKKDIYTVYFIRPEEDFFVRKYGITRSWDEFGVPSVFFAWVPEFFVKQIVFEQTGDRILADKIVVKHWLGQKEYNLSGMQAGEGILLIDAEKIMSPAHYSIVR